MGKRSKSIRHLLGVWHERGTLYMPRLHTQLICYSTTCIAQSITYDFACVMTACLYSQHAVTCLAGMHCSAAIPWHVPSLNNLNSCYTGCEDGTVTVWDMRTRQPIRTLQKAGKGPVTALLVMDRPAFLAAGQGGRGEKPNSSAHNSSKKGPQRPQSLAPFSKYYGAAGGVKPWEGVPVVIDGSTPYR